MRHVLVTDGCYSFWRTLKGYLTPCLFLSLCLSLSFFTPLFCGWSSLSTFWFLCWTFMVQRKREREREREKNARITEWFDWIHSTIDHLKKNKTFGETNCSFLKCRSYFFYVHSLLLHKAKSYQVTLCKIIILIDSWMNNFLVLI